jgi:hypothetical protein
LVTSQKEILEKFQKYFKNFFTSKKVVDGNQGVREFIKGIFPKKIFEEDSNKLGTNLTNEEIIKDILSMNMISILEGMELL